MNIHFSDESLRHSLDLATIHSQEVGSVLYGLDNAQSDIDLLNIYVDSDANNRSLLWEHHQLQYKESNVDYNYVNLQTFVRNVLTGDSTLSFEAIQSREFMSSDLSGLGEAFSDFINFRIIRSYLGLARRDAKSVHKLSHGFRKHNAVSNKKMSHFVRGTLFADMLLKNEFTTTLGTRKSTLNNTEYTDLELLLNIKNGTIDDELSEIFNSFSVATETLREEAVNRLQKGEIEVFAKKEKLEEIDQVVKDFTTDVEINYGDIFYKAMASGVEY